MFFLCMTVLEAILEERRKRKEEEEKEIERRKQQRDEEERQQKELEAQLVRIRIVVLLYERRWYLNVV
jgi:hypothetical protein